MTRSTESNKHPEPSLRDNGLRFAPTSYCVARRKRSSFSCERDKILCEGIAA